jgi:FecR protein
MRTNGLSEKATARVEGGAGVPRRFAARRAAASRSTLPALLRSLAITGLVTLTAGCSGVATLQSVLRPDGADATVEDIQVFRNGRPVSPVLSMGLESGDEIQTEADSTAIIRFAGGTEVIVAPNTRIRIGSLWIVFGEIYVKARGLFRVETLYVTAGVEGTEYLLTVDHEAEMSMVVLDGVVRLMSKTGSWEPIALRKFEQGVFRPQEIPLMSRVDPVQGNRIIQAINQPVPQFLSPATPAPVSNPSTPGTGLTPKPLPQPGSGLGSGSPSSSPTVPEGPVRTLPTVPEGIKTRPTIPEGPVRTLPTVPEGIRTRPTIPEGPVRTLPTVPEGIRSRPTVPESPIRSLPTVPEGAVKPPPTVPKGAITIPPTAPGPAVGSPKVIQPAPGVGPKLIQQPPGFGSTVPSPR